ncbi:OmpA family protein [Dokdonia sp. Hel_I_63]|uniref:OmpA family protein n=1 Tax=Dokdonia sp. Hel_I_63 TaxID=1249996 RepID=UPI00119A58F6|nr:OmpA family protein [Dokdonia sp. Hel_I_63]TVZ21978.1 OmpA family protein [Dokdonia sp. Hel_I_63]
MRLITSFLLCLFATILTGQESAKSSIALGPPNPKPGVCYLSRDGGGEDKLWKAVLCEWKEYQTLEILSDSMDPRLSNYDKHYINKRVRLLLERKLSLEVESYYSSSASDTTDACLAQARAREVGEYLISQGLERNQLKITVLPVKDSVGLSLRVRAINALP